MLWVISKGGPVMIPILLASVLGLAIIIEKLWMLIRIKADTQELTAEVVAKARDGKFDKAIELCDMNINSPVAVTLKAGLIKNALEPHDIEKALERAGNNQVKEMEKYIGGLISIVGIEPLLGFLGTITGLIKAFMAWEKLGANVTVSALASGIYEAMITTAAGLIIAVPYYLACNFVISRIKYISYEMSDSSMQLAEAISKYRSKK